MRNRVASILFCLCVLVGCSDEEPEVSIEEESPSTASRSAGDFISFSGSVGTLKEGDITVPIAGRATLRGRDKDYPLFLTGAGIRKKKVLIVTASVYAAASYVSSQGVSTVDGVFRSQSKVLKLTMLRDVSADQLRDAFTESMKVNGVDVQKDPFWSQLFARLDQDIAAGQTVTFAAVTDEQGMDHLIITGPKTVTAKGVGLVSQFWRMWFGRPADDGIAELRPALLSYRP